MVRQKVKYVNEFGLIYSWIQTGLVNHKGVKVLGEDEHASHLFVIVVESIRNVVRQCYYIKTVSEKALTAHLLDQHTNAE